MNCFLFLLCFSFYLSLRHITFDKRIQGANWTILFFQMTNFLHISWRNIKDTKDKTRKARLGDHFRDNSCQNWLVLGNDDMWRVLIVSLWGKCENLSENLLYLPQFVTCVTKLYLPTGPLASQLQRNGQSLYYLSTSHHPCRRAAFKGDERKFRRISYKIIWKCWKICLISGDLQRS